MLHYDIDEVASKIVSASRKDLEMTVSTLTARIDSQETPFAEVVAFRRLRNVIQATLTDYQTAITRIDE